jgi:hypothetical protein
LETHTALNIPDGTSDGVFSSWPVKKCLVTIKGKNGESATIYSPYKGQLIQQILDKAFVGANTNSPDT